MTRRAPAPEWTPDFWQSWREAENPYRRFKSERDRRIALDLLAPRGGDRILEVGCGYGWISRALWRSARIRWTGVDRSESMLRHLRAADGAQSASSLLADAVKLPFGDGAFDRVLCTGVLMHIADHEAALGEMTRVLRPGGRLLCSINNAFSPFMLPTRLLNLRKPGFVQNFLRPGRFRRALAALGLRTEATAGDGVFTSVSVALGRISLPPRFLFPLFRAIDARVLALSPYVAHEVWFAAVKEPA